MSTDVETAEAEPGQAAESEPRRFPGTEATVTVANVAGLIGLLAGGWILAIVAALGLGGAAWAVSRKVAGRRGQGGRSTSSTTKATKTLGGGRGGARSGSGTGGAKGGRGRHRGGRANPLNWFGGKSSKKGSAGSGKSGRGKQGGAAASGAGAGGRKQRRGGKANPLNWFGGKSSKKGSTGSGKSGRGAGKGGSDSTGGAKGGRRHRGGRANPLNWFGGKSKQGAGKSGRGSSTSGSGRGGSKGGRGRFSGRKKHPFAWIGLGKPGQGKKTDGKGAPGADPKATDPNEQGPKAGSSEATKDVPATEPVKAQGSTITRPGEQTKGSNGSAAASTTGGNEVIGRQFQESANELLASAQKYDPERMPDFAVDVAQFPQAIRTMAEAMRMVVKKAEGEWPVDPALLEYLNEMCKAQERTANTADEILPAFRKMHEGEFNRHDAPRSGEGKWDVQR